MNKNFRLCPYVTMAMVENIELTNLLHIIYILEMLPIAVLGQSGLKRLYSSSKTNPCKGPILSFGSNQLWAEDCWSSLRLSFDDFVSRFLLAIVALAQDRCCKYSLSCFSIDTRHLNH